MSKYKETKAEDGRKEHHAAGAVIERDGKYLLMDRMHPPFGFASSAGHIDVGESPEETTRREVKEETSFDVVDCKFLIEDIDDGHACSHGVDIHKWHVYKCTVTGELKFDPREAKSMDWYSPEEMKHIKLEPIWEQIFTKLKIL